MGERSPFYFQRPYTQSDAPAFVATHDEFQQILGSVREFAHPEVMMMSNGTVEIGSIYFLRVPPVTASAISSSNTWTASYP